MMLKLAKISPNERHLFRALKNYLRDENFNDLADLKTTLDVFFSFWAAEVHEL